MIIIHNNYIERMMYALMCEECNATMSKRVKDIIINSLGQTLAL